jgi:Tol biopolymer transport system component
MRHASFGPLAASTGIVVALGASPLAACAPSPATSPPAAATAPNASSHVTSSSVAALEGVPREARPSSVPSVFAPGVISGPANDMSPTFTPEGDTVFFTRATDGASTILVSRRTAGGWSAPAIAPFSGEWNDLEPTMAPDGSYLVFASSRPIAPGAAVLDGEWGGKPHPKEGGNLWRVDRVGAGFGVPVRLPDGINRTTSTFAPAIAKDGSLYFMEPGAEGRFGIYRAQRTQTGYAAAVRASFSDAQWNDCDPAVAPDESFAVFSSSRAPAQGLDLFVVRRGDDGAWGAPIHMGTTVNSRGSDIEARFGPDGKTLYYSNGRVVPTTFPRSRAVAEREVAELQWNNGIHNIWQVDLSTWLTATDRPAR